MNSLGLYSIIVDSCYNIGDASIISISENSNISDAYLQLKPSCTSSQFYRTQKEQLESQLVSPDIIGAAPAHSRSGETLHITFLEGIVVGLVIEILECILMQDRIRELVYELQILLDRDLGLDIMGLYVEVLQLTN